MEWTEQPAAEAPTNLDVRFEESDVHVRGVVVGGIGILLTTWIVATAMYGLYVFAVQSREVGTPSAVAAGRQVLPPEPRLQESPRKDLAALRALEESELHSYQWVNQSTGAVSIPIERAIELLAQRGIPPQAAPDEKDYPPPEAGTRETGFEGKVEPEPR